MLKAENVQKTIENQTVLTNISFELPKGSIAGLLGRNGAGKTTLIRMLVGILSPDKGTVTYDGEDVHQNPDVKQRVAYVPDSTNLLNGYTVKEIVRFYESVYKNFDTAYFYGLLHRFNLPERRIRSYSRGMKASLAMILAFSTKAEYIILDEPTNGLDPIVKRQVLQFIVEEVAERNVTVLISTHHLDEVEKIADTIIVVKDHEIASITSVEAVKNQYVKIQVAFERSLPQKLENLHNVTLLSQTGKVYTLLIQNHIEATLDKFRKEQPILLEELPMSLEDIFVTTLGGDIYVS
ncbi:ABC transporter ATP-binding protein [Ectobacillus panaciterrae]|uniref:ABC transporter ATP-binding protein n=1 Tax=Ectobacillus panaciterrae TaxID=363872 RepID=UPI0004261A3D|nr:ABC transporter ATP-binding protein [Ectobacillus panaciterrae]